MPVQLDWNVVTLVHRQFPYLAPSLPPPPSPPSSLLFPYITCHPIRVQRGCTKRKGVQGGTRKGGGRGHKVHPPPFLPSPPARTTPFPWKGVRARAHRTVRVEGGHMKPTPPHLHGMGCVQGHATLFVWKGAHKACATPFVWNGVRARVHHAACAEGGRTKCPTCAEGADEGTLPPLPLLCCPVCTERGHVKAKPPPSYGAVWKGAHMGELSPCVVQQAGPVISLWLWNFLKKTYEVHEAILCGKTVPGKAHMGPFVMPLPGDKGPLVQAQELGYREEDCGGEERIVLRDKTVD
ncbi:hypothetical protein H4582DRAFT_2059152 [Lactarius indigo]|nr:hypothetical protein H4582DRAFT_2059152 [Lactarius indigo]